MIKSLSSKSRGMPWGLQFKKAPLPFVIGASNVGYSSVCCQNDNRRSFAFQGPVQKREALHIKHVYLVDEQDSGLSLKGLQITTISAFPSSLHSATFWSIWSLTSCLISPVSPEKRAKNPWLLLFITSISCKVTVWTTSFLFSISPSGH